MAYRTHFPPNMITLITTLRCDAACGNCCFGCRPTFGRTMSLDEMKLYIDKCLEAYPQSIKELSLTGGECFLLGDDLDKIIEYASSKGLMVSAMSNGYWGKSYDEAYSRIKTLKEKGLKSIGFSIGETHQTLIPLQACRNAAVASAKAGLKVEIRIETHRGESTLIDNLYNDSEVMELVSTHKITLISIAWKEFDNEIKHTKRIPWRTKPIAKCEPCSSIGGAVTITPYGDVISCCGLPSHRLPLLRVGNINQESVTVLHNRIYADDLKCWIRKEGPSAILQYVYDNSNIRFRHTAERCDCCYEIFSNPKIIPFLMGKHADWSKKLGRYIY